MNILGIWDGHDSGAALLVDGAVAAAVNEERFTRRKLEVHFPEHAIRACLRLAGLAPQQLDAIAASTTDPSKTLARVWPSAKESYYQVRRRLAPPGPLTTFRKRAKYWLTELGPTTVSERISRRALRQELSRVGLDGPPLTFHDHHFCHAVAAAAGSGFDRALVLTIDGVGDGASSTVSVLEHGRLTPLDRTPAQHSPGIFFEHVTNLLNMRELEDEGKVMALASYSPLPHTNPLRDLIGVDGLRFKLAAPGHSLRRRLQDILWRYPNEQFACMAQDALQHAVLALIVRAVSKTGIRQLALSGGVASNIQINRAIRMLPEVQEVFVFPHMGDGGLALGAALATAARTSGIHEIDLQGLALGPAYRDDEIAAAIERAGVPLFRPVSIADAVADHIAHGKIVMWFQGRMEYGPRALGGRSIVARADDPATRDRLNLVLKRRVWFQPFCPSLLESEAARLFCDFRGRPDRFMTMSYLLNADGRRLLSGVMGVDGTCRPQVVRDDACGPWPDLLRSVRSRLQVGAVLNTSFNIHGEPLVCTPADAIDVFRRSGADVLACGPYLIESPR